MSYADLSRLFEQQLRELHCATLEYRRALAKMMTSAQHERLRQTLLEHIAKAAEQLQILNEIGLKRQINLIGKQSFAMNGLIEDAMYSLEFDAAPTVVDIVLIDATRRMLHYQVAVAGSAHANAVHVSEPDVANLLFRCLESIGDSLETISCHVIDDIYAEIPTAMNAEQSQVQPDGESSGIFVWDCDAQMPCVRTSLR